LDNLARIAGGDGPQPGRALDGRRPRRPVFATNAIKSLRAVLNVACRVKEHRSVAKPISETPGAKTRASSVFAVTSIPASWSLWLGCAIGTKRSLAGLHASVAALLVTLSVLTTMP